MDPVAVAIIAIVVLLIVGVVADLRRGGDAPGADGEEADDGVELLEPEAATEPPAPAVEDEAAPAELTLAERFQERLSRTRNKLGVRVVELFGGGVDDEAWEGLEEALVAADVGVDAALDIVDDLRRRTAEQGITEAGEVVELLKDELVAQLGTDRRTLERTEEDRPTVWLLVGVNGTGKTTTVGKLAALEDREGRHAVLAATDTFRAAAADQLGVWAERTNARLVRKDEGADPASVAYDGYMAAKATDADLLLVDTAGRLHNRRELMDELAKIKRVVADQGGVEETLLVLDATTGQNGIAQAEAFTRAVDVTGIALTKLDGSSKGGIVVAVQRQLGIPVKLVGLGEQVQDLAAFDPEAFVDGLFAELPVG